MIDDALVEGMNAILAGASSELEELYGWFVRRPRGGATWFLYSSKEVFDVAGHHRIHLVLFEPCSFGAGNTAVTALKLRELSPEAVIAFLGDDEEIDSLMSTLDPKVKRRLSHYYRVHRGAGGMWTESADAESFKQLLKKTAAWHTKYLTTNSYPPRYEYDVAISFAGEDRQIADLLANSLKNAGVHVFFDSFEQANLWGKDLFTTLYEVYSQRARYCIMLISKPYADKQWTVHERRAAQERVLSERDNEYLLPIRIDTTSLPGLPKTISYLDSSLGIEKITSLFLDKLTARLASQSSFRMAQP